MSGTPITTGEGGGGSPYGEWYSHHHEGGVHRVSGTAITMGEGGDHRVSGTAITMGEGGDHRVSGTAITMGGSGL